MSTAPRTVLVTGATGLVGRAVVAWFVRRGDRVVAASRHVATAPAFPAAVRTVPLDITRPETIPPALDGVDIVVHAAARTGDWGARPDFLSVIHDGTAHLVAACAGRPLERFVHLSSTLFYGLHGSTVMTESMLPGDCPWPYAEGKVAAEEVVRRATHDQGLPAVILRPSNIFGPGSQNWTERPASLLERGLLSLPPDAGRANLVFVENVAAAIGAVCDHDAAVGGVFNVVDDTELTWRELFDGYAEAIGARGVITRPTWLLQTLATAMETWARVTGRAPAFTRGAIEYVQFRGTYAKGKLGAELGHQAPVPFDRALELTRAHLRERHRR